MTANVQMLLFLEDDQRKVGKYLDVIKIFSSIVKVMKELVPKFISSNS